MEPWDDNLLLDGGPQVDAEDGSTVAMAGLGQEAGRADAWNRERVRRRRRRAAAAVAVLLAAASVTVLLVLLLIPGVIGQRCPGHSSDISTKQHEHTGTPRAMLTAPRSINQSKEYLEWESKDGHAFCNGFNYSNGHLVVPRDGIYRVFLQITYESIPRTHHECFDEDEVKLIYIVWSLRESYSRDVRLMSSVDTVTCSMEPWQKSLYSAGLFHLDANTRLWVTSSSPHLIVKEEHQVFFGAEFLPQ